ncbi:MAG: hypothetical protein AAF619_12925 [Pseudomonadota bacterium]
MDAVARNENRANTLPWLVLGGVGLSLLVSGIGLWASVGTTVFFELLAAGWVACFG